MKTLSVSFADSSPRGRAKKMEHIDTDTLHKLFYDHPSKCNGGIFTHFSP